MPSSVLTFRYRIKDATSGKHLKRMAWAVHTVWNYCNEVSLLAWRREKRFLSAFELINLTAGTGQVLGLHTDTLSEICQEYTRRKRTAKKMRLKWRSRKRSLGWIPFKGRCVRLSDATIVYKGRHFRFWQSRPFQGTLKTGSFAQDAHGRWYVNLQCAVESSGVPLGEAELGIDLGLQHQMVCSDGAKYARENHTRTHEDALALAQRAHKKKRVKAIHAKIANCRKDWAHKTTTAIVNRATLIVIGKVSSLKLAKTRMAKSTLDAGWSQLRTMLAYKAMRLGVTYCEVNESSSSVTCSTCFKRTGPSGLSALGVRVWCCSACGVGHDRDINAAHNILRLGRETLSGIPRFSRGRTSNDIVTQAMTGAMSVTGEPGRPPVKLGLPMGDLAGGLFAALGILAALQERQRTGRGQIIDVGLYDCMVGLLGYLAELYLFTGHNPEPVGSGHHTIVPYGAYQASDGYIVIALHSGSFYRKFCEAIGRLDLASDPRFATNSARQQHKDVLNGLVADIVAQQPMAYWLELLQRAAIPAAPIQRLSDVLAHPQTHARQMLTEMQHPTAGTLPIIGCSPAHTLRI